MKYKEEKTIHEGEGYILTGIEIEQKIKLSARNDYGVKFESIWVRRAAIPALIAYLQSVQVK